MPSLDYLLGEITVDDPHGDRDRALKANPGMVWPEEHWAVSDEHHGYLAFMRFKEDALAFRIYLVSVRLNGAALVKKYEVKDGEVDAQERDEEWVVVSRSSNGDLYLGEDGKPTKELDKAMGFTEKSDADNWQKHFKRPPSFVKRRRQLR